MKKIVAILQFSTVGAAVILTPFTSVLDREVADALWQLVALLLIGGAVWSAILLLKKQ